MTMNNFSVENSTFVNAYVKLEDSNGNTSIKCQAIGEINPETFDTQKALAITEALENCLSSKNPTAQVIAVKKVEGKKFVVT